MEVFMVAIGLALFLITGTASAKKMAAMHGLVRILNRCDFDIYVESNTQGVANREGVVHISPAGLYTQSVQHNGTGITISTHRALSSPLTLGYNIVPGMMYYDLSTGKNNSLCDYGSRLVTTEEGCPTFDCEGGDDACYSGPGAVKVKSCAVKGSRGKVSGNQDGQDAKDGDGGEDSEGGEDGDKPKFKGAIIGPEIVPGSGMGGKFNEAGHGEIFKEVGISLALCSDEKTDD